MKASKRDCYWLPKEGLTKKGWICDHDHTEGGGSAISDHISFRKFFQCSKHICLVPGSPKTNFVFTPNSIYHIYSYWFDPLVLNFHHLFLEFFPPQHLRRFAQIYPNILQNPFYYVANNPIIRRKKTEENNKHVKVLWNLNCKNNISVEGIFFPNLDIHSSLLYFLKNTLEDLYLSFVLVLTHFLLFTFFS